MSGFYSFLNLSFLSSYHTVPKSFCMLVQTLRLSLSLRCGWKLHLLCSQWAGAGSLPFSSPPSLPPSLLLSLSSSLDGSLSLFLYEISLAGPAWKTRAGLQPLAVTSSVQWPPPPPPPSMLWMRRVLSGVGALLQFFPLVLDSSPDQCQQLTLLIS